MSHTLTGLSSGEIAFQSGCSIPEKRKQEFNEHTYPTLHPTFSEQSKQAAQQPLSLFCWEKYPRWYNHHPSMLSERQYSQPDEHLAVTLGYLAMGETYHSLEYSFRISSQTISIVSEQSCALYKVLQLLQSLNYLYNSVEIDILELQFNFLYCRYSLRNI